MLSTTSEKNILDFGAEPSGVLDSSPAFMKAIASFLPPGSSAPDPDSSVAGIVTVPLGIFRLASTVSIKKSVWIRGSTGLTSGIFAGCIIKPDPGITAFTIERHNTPDPPPSAGAGDGAQISNLTIQNPNHKVLNWQPNHNFNIPDRVRVGPASGQGALLLGENWYRHYECTTAGTSSASGEGPRSIGSDKILNYVGKTGIFTIGQTIKGTVSRASATIIADSNAGASGELRLTSVSGSFLNNEAFGSFKENQTVIDPLKGAALANGPSTAAPDDEHDNTVRWKYIGPGASIKVRANGVTIRDVYIDNMSGSGIHIHAQDPEVPNAVANANGWMLRNVSISGCDGHGLFVRGSDTQGGAYIGGVVTGNGGRASDEDFTGPGFNIYESSFLGNTYISIQLGGGGQGSIFSNSIGGGNTFIGCYQEGSGGGQNVVDENCVVIGGGLSVGHNFKTSSNTESAVVTIAPQAQGNGLGQVVWGYNGPDWRPLVWVPLGHRRQNRGNLYEVVRAGTTGAGVEGVSGGPSGTDPNIVIVDGDAHWKFVHKVTPDGSISFGSVDPETKSFFTVQAPDDVSVGFPSYYRYDKFVGASDVHGFMYGVSGAGGESGVGIMHAVNRSILTVPGDNANEVAWPMHVPAGRAIAEFMWIGGCRVAFGTAEPKVGTWNKGDRIFFQGFAVSAGGAEGLICTEGGTAGSYPPGVGQIARTATTHDNTTVDISGAPMGTLKYQQDFKVGDVLTIGGVTSRVLAVSDDGLQLRMNSPIPAANDQSIAFKNPMFNKFGSIAAKSEGEA